MLRSVPLILAAVLFIGCMADPPDGIVVESEADMPWQNPDTVSVLVTGKEMGSIRWSSPNPEQLEWLEGRGYKKDTTLYSERATERLQRKTEDTGSFDRDVMGRVYYVQSN